MMGAQQNRTPSLIKSLECNASLDLIHLKNYGHLFVMFQTYNKNQQVTGH